jgi:hypothetical protein
MECLLTGDPQQPGYVIHLLVKREVGQSSRFKLDRYKGEYRVFRHGGEYSPPAPTPGYQERFFAPSPKATKVFAHPADM